MRLLKAITVTGLAAALLASGVHAETTCPNGTPYDAKVVTATMDKYYEDPFSAVSWRVLNGLGDPGLEPSYAGENQWKDRENWTALVAKLAPSGAAQAVVGYKCRVGNALSILKKRAAELGESHLYVGRWIAVQSAVLKACDDSAAAVELPQPLTITGDTKADHDLRGLQEFDRAYQQSTLLFYQSKHEEALAAYRSISATVSPHRAAARYMAANTLANSGKLPEAASEARSILADRSLAEVHAIAHELLGYITNLADDPVLWNELLDEIVADLSKPASDVLASDNSRQNYRRALYDIEYFGVRGQSDDWWLTGKLPENPTRSKAVYDGARRHPMVAWVIAGQTLGDLYASTAWQVIGESWRSKTSSYARSAKQLVPAPTGGLAWEMFDALAATSTEPNDSGRASWLSTLTDSVTKSCGAAPEAAAVGVMLHHHARLLTEQGEFTQAEETLKAFPLKDSVAFRHTVMRLGQYLLGTGRTEEGRRFRDEFAKYPSIAADADFASLAAFLAEDQDRWRSSMAGQKAVRFNSFLNLMSARQLAELSKDAALPQKDRAVLARMAWARVYALGKQPDSELTGRLLELNPGIAAIVSDVQKSYPAAQESWRWLLTVLRTPRLAVLYNDDNGPPTLLDSYNHNDLNWWCPINIDRHLGALRSNFDYFTGNDAARPPELGGRYIAGSHRWYRNDDWFRSLVDAEKAAELDSAREKILRKHPAVLKVDWKELTRLAKAPSAPKLLSQRAVQWARRGGKLKDGVGEALSLSLTASRYGCNWAGSHKAYTRAAVGILQTKFKDSTWAKQTPYWYDCLWHAYEPDTASFVKKPTCKAPQWPKQELPR